MTRPSPNRKRQQRGAALVEFAVSWALLWAMFAGLFQFGYSFMVYNRLKTTVANAAAFAARMEYDTSNTSAFTTSLKNLVVYGDLTASGVAVVPGLTTGNVSVQITSSSGTPQYVTISVTGFSVNAVFGNFSFAGKPRATTAYYGNLICSGC